jgi:pyruvate-ferredoxin/flavodoxin oxidoreductase
MRYNPAVRAEGKNPFFLDSRAPSIPLKDYIYSESRYTMLERAHPDTAAELLKEATDDVERTWRVYSSRAAMPGRENTPNISPRNGHETNGHETGAGAPAAKTGDQN